jgi:hypothetical protein
MKNFMPQNKLVFWISLSLLSLLIFAILSYGLLIYTFNPANIRTPKPEHLHFRMQLIVNGNYTNFGETRFQESYLPGACSFDITETPVHFHDGEDQIVHIHWKKVTGGQVLKYYGINLIDYFDNTLGYRTDESFIPQRLGIHDRNFDDLDKHIKHNHYNLFVYSGDKGGYQSRNYKDFLNQDLEAFFGKNSLITNSDKNNFFNPFKSLDVSAHSDHGSDKDNTNSQFLQESLSQNPSDQPSQSSQDELEISEDELKVINNLIGNVVIFIQPQEPTEDQVKERFNNLVPLKNSVCGG